MNPCDNFPTKRKVLVMPNCRTFGSHRFEAVGFKVALATAPLQHRAMDMKTRCECALTGFILVDLFRLYAADLCARRGWPTGSAFLASQTACNLQGCALSAVTIAMTKPVDVEPWRGSSRLTELSIEQLFGALRQQSPNAQLSTRQYFAASAKHALRQSKVLNREKALPGTEL